MPLTVHLLAMSPSSQRTISGFIKTKGKNHFKLTESIAPDCLIIDIDNSQGKKLLNQYENSGTHIIVLSLSKQNSISETTIQIQKPITGVELLRAAEKINKAKKFPTKNALNIKTSVTPEKADKPAFASSKDQPKSIPLKASNQEVKSYDPSETFQGMLRKAIQLSDRENTPVLISVQQYKIEIIAHENRARLNFSKKRLRTLCQFPLTDHICEIKKGLMISDSTDNTAITLPEISWDVALFCSRGRLPKNMNNLAQYQLKTWPNLTRWSKCEHSMQMASLWSKGPASIQSITNQLNIPIENVCRFITAAIDSGLANKCNDAIEVASFENKKGNRALLKKLLNRLKRA